MCSTPELVIIGSLVLLPPTWHHFIGLSRQFPVWLLYTCVYANIVSYGLHRYLTVKYRWNSWNTSVMLHICFMIGELFLADRICYVEDCSIQQLFFNLIKWELGSLFFQWIIEN